jgi:hypothetical protein
MAKLPLMGVMMVVATTAFAEEYADHSDSRVSLEVSGGFVGDYDDSNMWQQGYNAGVGAFWWASESIHLGACLALTHWSYDPDDVVAELVPDNATLLATQSTGQIEILELIPSVRWERHHLLPFDLGGFVQAGVGVAYAKTFALTEVSYQDGPASPEAASQEIDQSAWRMDVVTAVGLTHSVSESSWLEVFPSYRIMNDVPNVFAVSIGYRLHI